MAKSPKKPTAATPEDGKLLYRINNPTAVHVAIEDGKEVVYHGTGRLDLQGRTSIRMTPEDAKRHNNLDLKLVGRERIEVKDEADDGTGTGEPDDSTGDGADNA